MMFWLDSPPVRTRFGSSTRNKQQQLPNIILYIATIAVGIFSVKVFKDFNPGRMRILIEGKIKGSHLKY